MKLAVRGVFIAVSLAASAAFLSSQITPSLKLRTQTTSRWPASSTRNGKSQTDHFHHSFFLRLDDDRFEAGGLDRGVGILQAVTGHGGGDDAACRDAVLFNAFRDSRQRGGAGGFDEKPFGARE